MDPRFMNWIIKKHEEIDPENKQIFLKTLKFYPDLALSTISSALFNWGTVATFELHLNCLIIDDVERDSRDVLKALQDHFAKEMAAITQ